MQQRKLHQWLHRIAVGVPLTLAGIGLIYLVVMFAVCVPRHSCPWTSFFALGFLGSVSVWRGWEIAESRAKLRLILELPEL